MEFHDTWWQRFTTSIIHGSYRVVVDYEVEIIWHERWGCTQRYTGRSKMSYVPA